ncbi:GTP-binding protein 2 [Cimex lectularius]|uniref:Tr-type G domain-containing protein n=1 Tax=Cimex lectularius TaxID=79782 RepID=A0A8I6R9P4_CIMLE|nr:GTP-binding protein 2 [Cimex lectularius]XP_014241160.1 GTP-binding protein 2 [Cimex lectularius]XP_014241161.1 GTP-binding protein 2 [Cimex lectularius]
MDSFLGLFDPNDNCLEGQLPPEPQLGNIEYKLKLLNPSRVRFQHLVTQLKWRLREGGGEAIYEIGVEDSGLLAGLPSYEMDTSLKTLSLMAAELGATTTILREREVACGRKVTEVLVRKVPADQHTIEVRVAVMGSADAGKSTLVGVLTQGELDNGRGRARLNTFRHLHEVQSGRTSSISHATLGFDSQGKLLNCFDLECGEDNHCTKLISLLDLAGHRKYLRTTVQAVSGYCPHHAMLVVSSQAGVVGMTREHVAIAAALEVPMFIVVTKTDLGHSRDTIVNVKQMLTSPGIRKVPIVIKTVDDVITASANQQRENVVPIFSVSSVTGEGLDLLHKFLHVLPPGISTKEKERLDQELPEFQIDEIFRVADVGTVVGGLLTKGILMEGTELLVGPLDDGTFSPVKIQSLHRNKAPCRAVHSTQSASLALEPPPKALRSGMVLVKPEEDPTSCIFFQATVCLLYHSTSIHPGFQTTVHIGNIRQTAVIEGIMSQASLHTNDKASILFRFVRHPEFIRVGARLLFREGFTKGIGHVTQVFPYSSKHNTGTG